MPGMHCCPHIRCNTMCYSFAVKVHLAAGSAAAAAAAARGSCAFAAAADLRLADAAVGAGAAPTGLARCG